MEVVHFSKIKFNQEIIDWVKSTEEYKSECYIETDEDILWLCSAYGKVDFVKYILNKDVSQEEINNALEWASNYKQVEIIKILNEYITKNVKNISKKSGFKKYENLDDSDERHLNLLRSNRKIPSNEEVDNILSKLKVGQEEVIDDLIIQKISDTEFEFECI